MPVVERIFGPPGTGKTETLLGRVESELSSGVLPEELGYVSYTVAAAREARGRAMAQFQLTKEDLPYFGTIHSICYHQLDLKRNQVMESKLKDFAKAYGYQFSDGHEEELEVKEMTLRTLDDHLLFFEDWRRHKLLFDLEVAYNQFPLPNIPQWSLPVVRKFHNRYSQYKADNNLVDFTDMLIMVLEQRERPPIRALVVDEAQDLSPLMYRVIQLWMGAVERLYLAGDEDQCVYAWFGADPSLMLGVKSDKDTYLTQSFRVPRASHDLAMAIISKNRHRVDKAYFPTGEVGYIRLVSDLSAVPLEDLSREGTVFILVRNLYLLPPVIDELYLRGLPFTNLRGDDPFRGYAPTAVLAAWRLANGKRVAIGEINKMLRFIPSKPFLKHGMKVELLRREQDDPYLELTLPQLVSYFKSELQELFACGEYWKALNIKPRDRAYYYRLFKRHGENIFLRKPQITIGSIHSVKGKECDSTVVSSDMSGRSYEEYRQNPEGERRVQYVAATRNRKGLYIVKPSSQKYYTWG